MKVEKKNVIQISDWDEMVEQHYGKLYSFQQQDGCRDRGVFHLEVPNEGYDYENDTVPEIVNGEKQGVSFKAWLERDPKAPLKNENNVDSDTHSIELWWHRNFYPDIQMIANDLHAKGLLPAGEYMIEIDW